MSQRLSASATFQALTARMSALESIVQGGFTANGIATALGFTPASTAGNNFAGQITSPGFGATNGLGTGGLQMLPSFAAGHTGVIEFLKSDGTRNAYVGFNADAGAMQYGSDTGAGHNFTGGLVSIDGPSDQKMSLRGAANPYIAASNAAGSATLGYVQWTAAGEGYLAGNAGARLLAAGGTVLHAYVGGADVVGSFSASSNITSGDANFGLMYQATDPSVAFDSTDYLSYSRAANSFGFAIGNANKASLNANGFTHTGALIAGSYVQAGDGNFFLQLANSGADPEVVFDSGDFIAFNRPTNKFTFAIGGAAKATIDGNGVVLATQFQVDANFYTYVSSGTPVITFDSGGDYIAYDRTANKFNFFVGGTKVASIDGGGNMKLLGTLTQSTTP